MKKGWLVVLACGLALVLFGIAAKLFIWGKETPGALQISTVPKSTIMIDGVQTGISPLFNDNIKAGEHTIKLVPESSAGEYVSWEGKVKVASSVLTIINWEFAGSEAGSSGEVITLEKIASRKRAALNIISIPDQAVVKVDGEAKGFSPYLGEDLVSGAHQVVISAAGYEEKIINPNLVDGYKLVANIRLAQKIDGIVGGDFAGVSGTPTPSPKISPVPTGKVSGTPTPSPKTTPTPRPTGSTLQKPYIVVKQTSTGWLRVREQPNSTAAELTKIYPDETYPYLNETANGWLKIEYETGKQGWVSGTYVELVK